MRSSFISRSLHFTVGYTFGSLVLVDGPFFFFFLMRVNGFTCKAKAAHNSKTVIQRPSTLATTAMPVKCEALASRVIDEARTNLKLLLLRCIFVVTWLLCPGRAAARKSRRQAATA